MLVTGVRTLVKVMIMIIVGHSSGTFAIYSFVFCCQQKRIEGKRSCVCHTGQCPTALSVCLSHTVQCPTALSVCLSHHVSVRVSVPPCIYWLSSLGIFLSSIASHDDLWLTPQQMQRWKTQMEAWKAQMEAWVASQCVDNNVRRQFLSLHK